MQSETRNYIYCNDENYTSYDSLKYLFVCVFLFMSLITGVFAIVAALWWGYVFWPFSTLLSCSI